MFYTFPWGRQSVEHFAVHGKIALNSENSYGFVAVVHGERKLSVVSCPVSAVSYPRLYPPAQKDIINSCYRICCRILAWLKPDNFL